MSDTNDKPDPVVVALRELVGAIFVYNGHEFYSGEFEREIQALAKAIREAKKDHGDDGVRE